MLRISCAAEDGARVTLVVEGWLVGAWVPVLEAECLDRLDARQAVALDIADVSLVDRDGIRALRGLLAGGVEVTRANPLLDTLLGLGGAK